MKWAARGIVFLMAAYLCVIWVACYDRGRLDDKAVHYYSAARLYADRAHLRALREAYPAWISKLTLSRPFFDNRISSFANYVIPSSLLRLALQMRLYISAAPPESFAAAVKYAFFLAYLFSLFWVAAATWRRPFLSVFLFSCLTIASLPGISLSWMIRDPGRDMVFFHFVPRGSAILFVLGALAAYWQKKRGLFIASCLLLFGWHFGLAAVEVALILITLGLAVAVGRFCARERLILRWVVFLCGCFVSLAAVDPFSLVHLWIPLIVIYIFLILGCASLNDPWLSAVFLSCVYLFPAQIVTVLLGNPRIGGWLADTVKSGLVREFSYRLSGSMQIAAIVLLSAGVILVLRLAFVRVSGEWRRRAFVGAALILLIAAVYARKDKIGAVLAGRSDFFWKEDVFVNRRELAPRELHELDPNRQVVFFASLGDFLLRPLPEK